MKYILLTFELIVFISITIYILINADKPTTNLINFLSLINADLIILMYIQLTKKHGKRVYRNS